MNESLIAAVKEIVADTTWSTPTPARPTARLRVVVEMEPPDYIESILLVRPRNRLQRISLTYPDVDGVGGGSPIH